MFKTKNLLGLILFIPALAQAASLSNGSFETGNFSAWSTNTATLASVVTNTPAGIFSGLPLTYSPTDGNFLAFLSAGLGPFTPTTLSQTFTAAAGSTLSFDIFFHAGDYLPYNDSGFAILLNGINLFQSDVNTVGNYKGTPWTHVSDTLASGGTYTLQFGVQNWGDNNLPSYLGVDNVVVTTPIPAAVYLVGSALAGVFGFSRRKAGNGIQS